MTPFTFAIGSGVARLCSSLCLPSSLSSASCSSCPAPFSLYLSRSSKLGCGLGPQFLSCFLLPSSTSSFLLLSSCSSSSLPPSWYSSRLGYGLVLQPLGLTGIFILLLLEPLLLLNYWDCSCSIPLHERVCVCKP